ncbi:hypothetical protein GCM10007935_07850 [Hydrogenophaga electricum]|uniref:Uncharacterized protein n=1 Tax=Hydrogenophaga electricum TaxID=1230953 RepID=A0ABQ6C4T3_9BURK|nr:hypothetical protein GCM10007935_07850 [Hydrogenophaga electricum]
MDVREAVGRAQQFDFATFVLWDGRTLDKLPRGDPHKGSSDGQSFDIIRGHGGRENACGQAKTEAKAEGGEGVPIIHRVVVSEGAALTNWIASRVRQ